MKKILIVLFALPLLFACNNVATPPAEKTFDAQNSVEDLAKVLMDVKLLETGKYTVNYKNSKLASHSRGIIESLKVVEKIEVPNTPLTAVFLSYSVGIDIVRESFYAIKDNGKYYVYSGYISSYEDDPFKNGMKKEGKALVEKMNKWKKSNEDIPWW